MREILTIIACLLVALLTAALAGPWFIDWTAQRATIEAELSQALGVPVHTRGSIDLKLLPTPRLVLAGVEIGDRKGPPLLRSGEARFELAVTPLLRGELHFIEASLEAPHLRIDPAVGLGGGVAGPVRLPEEVRFERIHIHDGSVTLVRNTGDFTLTGIDLDAEADSLAGPFKGSGSVQRGDTTVPFRFATGAREGRRMRLKLVSDEAPGLPHIDLEGAAEVPEEGLAAARFDGTAALSGTSPLSWKASGPVRLDASGATSDGLDLKIGADEGALAFTLAGTVYSSAPHAELTLAARQLDLDRFGAAQSDQAQTALDLLSRLLDDETVLQALPLPIKLAVQSPTVQVGGDALTDVSLDLGLVPGQPVSLSLQAAGPGRAQMALGGFVETGAAARYSGEVALLARDLPRTTDWLRAFAPGLAERLKPIPFRLVDVKGRVTASAAGLSGSGLTIRVDRSSMTGSVAYTRPVGTERARLYADLNADALDLDGVPDLSAPGRALADTDLQLALDARAVRLARFGKGMIDSGRISLRLQKTPDELRIEHLSVADLGGANVTASGDMRREKAQLDVRLNAQRLGELAGLIRRVAPGPWADALAARAVALSPARLSFQFGAARQAGAGDLRLTGLRLDGSLRDTKISGRATPDGGDVDLQFAADGGDAALVLRQLGLDTVPLAGSGRAHLSLTGRGAPARGFDGTVTASVAGTDLDFSGHVGGDIREPTLQGAVQVRSEDAGRLLRVMAMGLPDMTQSVPVDLKAQVVKRGANIDLLNLAGSAAGTPVAGALTLARDGDLRLGGDLRVDQASVPGLVSLLLGPQQAAKQGVHWSTSAFAPGFQDALPVSVAVKAPHLLLGQGVIAHDAAFTFRLAPGLLALEDFSAHLDDGALSGRLVLRRDGASAAMSGQVKLADLPLDRSGVSGRLSGALTFTSTGANAAALAGGLAGSGAAQIAGYRFARADPGAPARVIAQSDEGSIYVSENDYIGALRRELARAPLDLGDQTFDASMAAGVLRLASAGGQSLTLDLRTLSMEARTLLTAAPLPKDWKGPAPQLTVINRDGDRDLDAGAFVNALAARAITREAARVEALEADIRERAGFARYRRGMDFLHQREAEVKAFEAEQERLAQEAAKQAAKEAAKQAAEEAKRRAEAEKQRAAEEKQRVEEERRRAEEARRKSAEDERKRVAEEERRKQPVAAPAAPLNITPGAAAPAPIRIAPPAPPVAPVFQAPPAHADPSAAGRY